VAYDLTAEELKERLHFAAATYYEGSRRRIFERAAEEASGGSRQI